MPQSFKGVMHEWKTGKLHSGSKHGPAIPRGKAGQKQALAIAFAQAAKRKGKG